MPKPWFAVVVALVAGCGSVSSKPDGGSPGDGAGSSTGALTLAKPSSWVPQTKSRTVDFMIARDASTTGALTVHVASLPAGVTAADVSVAAGASSGTLTFAADASSTLGSANNVDVQLLDGATMLDTKPFTVKVSGLPGTVDTTFGNGGKAVVPLPDPAVGGTMGNSYVRALLTYPASAGADADKILVAAEVDTTGGTSTTYKGAIVRLKADGSPDATFGGGAGYALVDGSPAHGFLPVGLALDSAGRIVVAAYHITTADVCTIYVTRLTAAGGADSSFTTFDTTPDSSGYCGNAVSVAVLPGDKILVGALWNNSDGSQRPLLLELNSDGSRSTAFNGSSSIRLPNPDTDKPSWELTHGLYVDANGYIYLTGAKCEGGWSTAVSACESVVGRLTGVGAWDTSWGSASAGHKGYSQVTFGSGTNASLHQGFENVAHDAAGKLVAIGYNEGFTTGTIARFDAATGALDGGFGASGHVTPVLVTGGTVQQLDATAIDSAGNVIVAGYANSGGSLLVTTRYTSAGVLDTSWGTAGVQTVSETGISPQAALQSDDRFIAGGGTPRNGNGSDVAVWRYWP
jgi:uncharacterized delta-60 repeat protein